MVAEFESGVIRARTKEGMKVPKAKGRLRGKQPKLSNTQQKHLMEVHNAGTHSTAEIAELFNVARSTVYRTTTASGTLTSYEHQLTRPQTEKRPRQLGTLNRLCDEPDTAQHTSRVARR